MMREVSLETLPNVNIPDPSHDKNIPIMSVTGSINQNVFKITLLVYVSVFYTVTEVKNRLKISVNLKSPYLLDISLVGEYL